MNNPLYDVAIVGAGASGLMAARILAHAGMKVIVIEAQNRIGGRIYPVEVHDAPENAQAGAEFIHGEAPLTRSLMREADIGVIPSAGDTWAFRNGSFEKTETLIPESEMLFSALRDLEADMPFADFLESRFPGEEHAAMRQAAVRVAQGYDGADSRRISAFSIRDEWTGSDEWEDAPWPAGGYGTLLNLIEDDCRKLGVEFLLEAPVASIDISSEDVFIALKDDKDKEILSRKVIVTVPLPLIQEIEFTPRIPQKTEAASRIGFGTIIKILLSFTDRWWLDARGLDLKELAFIVSTQEVPTWWTRYPGDFPALTGWLGGPGTSKLKAKSESEVIDIAISSLSSIFSIEESVIRGKLVLGKVFDWQKYPYAKGGYSYSTIHAADARRELSRPEKDTLYFAGEALHEGEHSATVEAAFATGKSAAEKVIESLKRS